MSQGFRVLGSQGFNVWCHFCLYDSVYWQCWGNLKVVLVMFAHSLTLLSDVNIFWRNSSDADHIGRQKMGRLGTADEIASLVLYLSSDEVEISCPWFLFSFSTSTQTMDMVFFTMITMLFLVIMMTLPQSSYTTGACHVIDGGWSIWAELLLEHRGIGASEKIWILK